MGNFLVPDIDTSGIRSADIQARNANYLNQLAGSVGLSNQLKKREIELAPEMERRKKIEFDLKTEADKFELLKAKAAIASDFLPQVTQDTYDDYLSWMDEFGLPSRKLMKSVEEIQKMKPQEFEIYKRQSQMSAKDFVQMSLEDFKARSAENLARQKHGYATEEIKQKHTAKIEEIEGKKKAESEKIWVTNFESGLKRQVGRDEANRLIATGKWKEGQPISNPAAMEARLRLSQELIGLRQKKKSLGRKIDELKRMRGLGLKNEYTDQIPALQDEYDEMVERENELLGKPQRETLETPQLPEGLNEETIEFNMKKYGKTRQEVIDRYLQMSGK